MSLIHTTGHVLESVPDRMALKAFLEHGDGEVDERVEGLGCSFR